MIGPIRLKGSSFLPTISAIKVCKVSKTLVCSTSVEWQQFTGNDDNDDDVDFTLTILQDELRRCCFN